MDVINHENEVPRLDVCFLAFQVAYCTEVDLDLDHHLHCLTNFLKYSRSCLLSAEASKSKIAITDRRFCKITGGCYVARSIFALNPNLHSPSAMPRPRFTHSKFGSLENTKYRLDELSAASCQHRQQAV
jgi:hypothetical protein